MPKRLTKPQRRALLDIISDVNSEDIRSLLALRQRLVAEELPAWFEDWPIWSAGENMPGYLPDSPYCLFLTERAARGYCRELERDHSDDYVSDMIPTTLLDVLT